MDTKGTHKLFSAHTTVDAQIFCPESKQSSHELFLERRTAVAQSVAQRAKMLHKLFSGDTKQLMHKLFCPARKQLLGNLFWGPLSQPLQPMFVQNAQNIVAQTFFRAH